MNYLSSIGIHEERSVLQQVELGYSHPLDTQQLPDPNLKGSLK